MPWFVVPTNFIKVSFIEARRNRCSLKENDNIVGIITERDFATKIAANNLPLDTPAQKIMSLTHGIRGGSVLRMYVRVELRNKVWYC